MVVMSEITRLLLEINDGRPGADRRLFAVVYDELRRMAAAKMHHERAANSLDATGLVHECYLRMLGSAGFESKRHFFAAAAEAMRRILIDRARARLAQKRGGDRQRADMDVEQVVDQHHEDQRLVQLDEALNRLAAFAPDKAELVRLRYFTGLTIRDAAELMEISTATADRYWAYARAWLQDAVQRSVGETTTGS